MPSDGAPPMIGLDNVVSSAILTLRGCATVVRGLDAERYTRVSTRIAGSTIGQHVRHSIDHFAAIAAALDEGSAGEYGVIDYDHRERKTPIEKEPRSALEALDRLDRLVGSLRADDLASGVRVRVMTGAGGEEAELGSTLARELAFAAHHATHHFAMIASIVGEQSEAGAGGAGLPEGFGRAPSTLNYEHGSVDRRHPSAREAS